MYAGRGLHSDECKKLISVKNLLMSVKKFVSCLYAGRGLERERERERETDGLHSSCPGAPKP